MPSTLVANNDGFSEPMMGVSTSSAKLDASRAGVTQHVNVMLLSAKCEYTLRCLPNWQLPRQFGLNCQRMGRKTVCDLPWADHGNG